MLVHKLKILPVECIVRGYLVGSGYKEYQETGELKGIKLPAGLEFGAKLPEPLFTPSTKAEEGHDMNIPFEEMVSITGEDTAERLRDVTLDISKRASAIALKKGIIIADTKMEFGVHNGNIIIIDELLTPDSSRFWPLDEYEPGKGQPSFDKQFLRDYLETLDWGKQAPAPELPEEIVRKTGEKYLEALNRLTA